MAFPSESGNGVAVLIVNYNAGRELPRCLAALREQRLSPGKIVVVDNASNDGSPAMVAADYPEVELIRLPQNVGFAAGNNRGLEACAGYRWIALLNPDAFAEPGWLSELLRTAEANPGAASFASRLVDAADSEIIDGDGDTYHVSGLAWRRHHGRRAAEVDDTDEAIFAPCAGAALYRLDALEQAGGFDEVFFCYFEDVDLGFRLRLLGYGCRYVPASVVRHVGSATTGLDSDFSVYHGHRNLVWCYAKNMPGRLLWRYLPQHLLMNFVILAYYTLRGRAGVIWRAKFDAVRGLPRALAERKEIQARRRVSGNHLRGHMSRDLLKPYIGRHV
ncbi:MAG: glycosyltransferase family 2 protein [Pseudomonadota bacterium]|nr:glycosyltransferase family 2 protein [Pseudomonadota bacterium]